MAAAFLSHRDRDEDEKADLFDELDIEPLLLPVAEERLEATRRLNQWLHGLVVQGLARWTRYL